MSRRLLHSLLASLAFLSEQSLNAAELYVSPRGTAVPPFGDWSTAATNIQDAIEAALDGDTVWVTNGIYATGGKAITGTLTNRIAIHKPITVQSVNGPWVTVIKGGGLPAPAKGLRCAWLTNGATLRGFTLREGSAASSGDTRGGGVWCSSQDALVANCIIVSNWTSLAGPAVHSGTIQNSLITGNGGIGNGSCLSSNALLNCTVVTNWYPTVASYASLTNCILYYNNAAPLSSCRLGWCCIAAYPGPGNIPGPPQLLPDGIHLSEASPCRASGTNWVTGTDIDGQAWSEPPSMGCDQWNPAPVLLGPPTLRLSATPVGFTVLVAAEAGPQYSCWWIKDGIPLQEDGHFTGTHTTNLVVRGVRPFDEGNYQVVFSNSFGVVTSLAAQLVLHYVDSRSPAPAPPYLNWSSAATSIQDAVDVAFPGEIVLVNDGVYASGGKVMSGDLTNRVAVDKAVLVQGANGDSNTTIKGLIDATATNGPGSVRCVWLTDGAILSGFTIRDGSTRASGSGDTKNGGGIWATSTNAVVANCLILSNSASEYGGGAYQGKLVNCTLEGNRATLLTFGSGGGAARAELQNCRITRNWAAYAGGGANRSTLRNSVFLQNKAEHFGTAADNSSVFSCTIVSNISPVQRVVAGVSSCSVTNSIVFWNGNNFLSGDNSFFGYSCTTPLRPGPGNINSDPQLLADGIHVGSASACIGAGLAAAVNGADLDGDPWASPPAIGCDQPMDPPMFVTAPQPSVSGLPPLLNVSICMPAGREPFSFWWYKEGNLLNSDGVHYMGTETTNLLANLFGPQDAGSYRIVASNVFGVTTSTVAQVVVHCVDAQNPSPVAPYADWANAANNIQDALDLAGVNDIVLVTNGFYSSGGVAVYPGLTNRIAMTKPMLLTSINGPSVTTIAGARDVFTTNGPGAVRCAWITNGARLTGFTLIGGATLTNGDVLAAQSGGGIYSPSIYRPGLYDTIQNAAQVTDCIIASNTANYAGGGVHLGHYERCQFFGNTAVLNGGGAYFGFLDACYLHGNKADAGGGAYGSTAVNCTIVTNAATTTGGGMRNGQAHRSILYYNRIGASAVDSAANYYNLDLSSSLCALPARSGWIAAEPELLDGYHIAVTSPCRAAAANIVNPLLDIEGEPWEEPKRSIGCDEPWEQRITGPLAVSAWTDTRTIVAQQTVTFSGQITGRATRAEWDYGDGTSLTNHSYLVTSHSYLAPGEYTVKFTAFNAEHVEGVSGTTTVRVIPLEIPSLSKSSLATGEFSTEMSSQSGVSYVLEQSTNLSSPQWETVNVVQGSGGTIRLTDPWATNLMRFYRVRISLQ